MRRCDLALVVVGASLLVLASCAPEPGGSTEGYTEGTVELSSNGEPMIGGRELPTRIVTPDLTETLQKYEGFRVGVAYGNREARVVPPLQDDWRDLTASVEDRSVLEWDARIAEFMPTPGGVQVEWDALTADFAAVADAPAGNGAAQIDAIIHRLRNLSRESLAAARGASSPQDRARLIAFADRARQEGARAQPKGYRGPYTREPEFYRRVAKNVDGAVAIYKGNLLDGSGFLVSPDWVVTADHVVAGVPTFAGMSVTFDYESASGTNGSKRCAVIGWHKPDPKTESVDVAALRIDCATLTQAQRESRVLTLSARVAGLDDDLYVIGHPGRSFKQVSDNSKLRFPHEVDATTRDLLRLSQPDKSQAQAWFDAFYRACGPNWCYFSPQTRWELGTGTDPQIPTFGFVGDTKPGNSGSAIFYVDDHSVAGLYFAGTTEFATTPAPDKPDFDFSRHEGAIPAAAVLQWLQSKNVL